MVFEDEAGGVASCVFLGETSTLFCADAKERVVCFKFFMVIVQVDGATSWPARV